MLAGIAGRGIPCVYVYRVAGDWGIGPGPCGSLRRADNGGYFSGLSVARGQGGGGAHVLLGEGSGRGFGHVLAEKRVTF